MIPEAGLEQPLPLVPVGDVRGATALLLAEQQHHTATVNQLKQAGAKE